MSEKKGRGEQKRNSRINEGNKSSKKIKGSPNKQEETEIVYTDNDTPDKIPKGEYKDLLLLAAKYSGPIPHPEILKKFAEISPDFPERIFRMAEKEQENRLLNQNKIVNAEIKDVNKRREIENRGQLYALIIGSLALIISGITALYGQPIFGGFIGISAIVSLVMAFILGRTLKNKNGESDTGLTIEEE